LGKASRSSPTAKWHTYESICGDRVLRRREIPQDGYSSLAVGEAAQGAAAPSGTSPAVPAKLVQIKATE
jgi:hypothetical protein